MMEVKRCSRCAELLPLDRFYAANKSSTWHKRSAYCKPCTNEYSRELRHGKGDTYREYARKFARRRKYGVTDQQLEEMYASQGGRCAICEVEQPLSGGAGVALHVDHCHSTGEVRGLLCSLCNLALGKFRDDPDTLRKALAYVGN